MSPMVSMNRRVSTAMRSKKGRRRLRDDMSTSFVRRSKPPNRNPQATDGTRGPQRIRCCSPGVSEPRSARKRVSQPNPNWRARLVDVMNVSRRLAQQGGLGRLPTIVVATIVLLGGTVPPGPGSEGDYSIAVMAVNGTDPPAIESLTLIVDQEPSVTSGEQAGFTLGQPGSFTVTTSDSRRRRWR